MKRLAWLLLTVFCIMPVWADKNFKVLSPNGILKVNVSVGTEIRYSVMHNGQILITPSAISMSLVGGKNFGVNSKLKDAKITSNKGKIATICYKKDLVLDNYNELTLHFKEGFNLFFRVYDEGLAYRFVSTGKKDFKVEGEQATFNFAKDWYALVPNVHKDGTLEQQFSNSFENTNTHGKLSALDKNKISFLPILVEADGGVKISVTEADLENYPGMFLRNIKGNTSLSGVFAPYPKTEKMGSGHNNLEEQVTSFNNYLTIAKAKAKFPWCVISVSADDKELLNNDMVYCLAAPSRMENTAWIKPGKVAWDWWNDWGIYNVPFKAGVNTQTYKAYIDFASKKGIEYVILDEGWAVNKVADLFQIVPEIDLPEIIRYAKEKNVGIILWAGCYAFDRDMEHVCRHYAEMGVKGFKIDFMNRDDAKMVDFHYRAAAMCAKYHLLVDFHGTYKPTGLNRTYPNVLNFEGIAGLEQNKWSTMETYDQVQFDTEIPFTRMIAGQMDYTQGAMLNGTKKTYHCCYSEPMSQGTRCHQLGEYVVFFSPLNMLCDSPTHYEKEGECADFIASIPTTWTETLPLDSKVGEYITIARCKGNQWYVGGITNWTARDLTLDLSFLGHGSHKAEAFYDGPNSELFAQDYMKQEISIPSDGKLKIHMAAGGGFALKIIN